MKEVIEEIKEDFFVLKTVIKLKKDFNEENFLIDNMLKTYSNQMYSLIKEIISFNLEFKFLNPNEEVILKDVSDKISKLEVNNLVNDLFTTLDTYLIDNYVKLLYKREGKLFITGALEKTCDDEIYKVLKDAYKVIKKS